MQERNVIRTAFIASLLLHLVLAAATWRVPLFPRVDPAALAADDDTVEMVLLPEQQSPDDPYELPRAYTEIPDRLASETPPEKADYLAMHHSLAADNVLGGDSDKPAADQQWESDQVAIRKEDLSGVPGVKVTEPTAPPPPSGARTTEPEAGQERKSPARQEGDRVPGRGDWSLSEPRPGDREPSEAQDAARKGEEGPTDQALESWWKQQQPSILKQGRQGSDGDRGFDFDQTAKGQTSSGVAIDGMFSLNTYEWDYAPWMHRFVNELYRYWVAPYAYRLGLLTGHTTIKLVVRKDGTVASMDVVEEEGHQSLHDASVAALRAFAPYAPLPPGFPEENLVITLGLYYPALQR